MVTTKQYVRQKLNTLVCWKWESYNNLLIKRKTTKENLHKKNSIRLFPFQGPLKYINYDA